MAHLTRCWCGRRYRCEQDHTPPPGKIRCFDIEPHHDNCPDFILHGRWTVEFKTITVPVFRGDRLIATSIVEDIEANSIKDPLP